MFREELHQAITDIFKTHFFAVITTGILIYLYSFVLGGFLNEYVIILNTIVFSIISLRCYLKLASKYNISITDFFKQNHMKIKDLAVYSALCCETISILIILIIVIALTFAAITLIFKLPIPNHLALVNNNSSEISMFVIQIIRGCLLAPVFEEITFRGVIFNILNKYSETAAIFFTSFFFAVVHGLDLSFILRYVVSVILIKATLDCRNLIPAILIHSSVNFVSSIYSSVSMIGNLTVLIIAIMNTVLVYYFFKKKYYARLDLSFKDAWETIKQGIHLTMSIKIFLSVLLFLLVL